LVADDVAGNIFRFGKNAEILQNKPVEEDDTDSHGENVEDKVPMVVDANTIVDPGTVMVMLRGAVFAHLTMFAA
jgi:hypothetical protein